MERQVASGPKDYMQAYKCGRDKKPQVLKVAWQVDLHTTPGLLVAVDRSALPRSLEQSISLSRSSNGSLSYYSLVA